MKLNILLYKLHDIINTVAKIDTEPDSWNGKYKLEAMGKLQNLENQLIAIKATDSVEEEFLYRCDYLLVRDKESDYPDRNYWTIVLANSEESANKLGLEELKIRFPRNSYRVESYTIEKVKDNPVLKVLEESVKRIE